MRGEGALPTSAGPQDRDVVAEAAPGPERLPAGTEEEDDPWATSAEDDPLLGAGTTEPMDPEPSVPGGLDPLDVGTPPASTRPVPSGAGAEPTPDDDPWAMPDEPTPGSGTPPATAGEDDDPWGGEDPLGGAPLAPGTTPTTTDTGFRETTREGRALEQVTRLVARPGDRTVEGYPDAVLVKAEPWVALREGPRPMVLIFYDNALRTSDELAAEILPTLARYSTKVDVVAIDRNPAAELTTYEQQVTSRFLGQSDDVPVIVVTNGQRKTHLARFAWFPAKELETSLRKALGMSPLGTGPDVAPRTRPNDPLAPSGSDGTTAGRGPGSRVPPGFERDGPTGRGVLPDSMTDREPAAPRDPLMRGPDPRIPREGGLSMGGPRVEQARAHASRLRASPGDSRLGGYPRTLLTRAKPKVALEPGHKPVVIVFYDDASRASNLQAGDILPVLVAEQNRADIVVINVSRGHERSDDETNVVKPYYPGSVPATVVLSASRAPVKLWFQRTSARSLESALREARAKR